MPYVDTAPTRATRIAGRGLCLASYILAFIVAVGDFWVPSSTLQSVVAREWATSMALVLAPLSVTGFFAVVAHRWRVEWVPATAITFLLLQRAVPVWSALGETPGYLSAAAMMTLGGLCLGKRALDLWIFFRKTNASAELAADECR